MASSSNTKPTAAGARRSAILGSEATPDAQTSAAKDDSDVLLMSVSSTNSESAISSSHPRGVDPAQLSSRLTTAKFVGTKLNRVKKCFKTYAKFVGPGFMVAVAYSKYSSPS